MADEEYPEGPSFAEEMENLSDEEVEEAILDRILDQGEIDTENFHIQCQNGIVSVEGVLPSAEQYQGLMRLLRDDLQLEHVVDRIRIQDEVVFGDDEDVFTNYDQDFE
jgi:osmotically-inducible protein OsmY